MKYAGKKVGLMPKDKESRSEDKGENERTERKSGKKIKKTGSFKGEPNKLGGGGRFKQMVAQGKSPALAAYIGNRMYGKAKMHKMAMAGRKKG